MGTLGYFQFQALFLWLVLAAGWTWSGINRRRERLRRLYGMADPLAGPKTALYGYAVPTPDSEPTAPATYGAFFRPPSGLAAAATPQLSSHDAAAPGVSSNICSLAGCPPSLGSPGAAAPTHGSVSSCSVPAPPVSVVMPVKGCRPHSLDNWESHLGVQYDGLLEFLFVVEAEDDPAVPELLELRRRHLQSRGLETAAKDSSSATTTTTTTATTTHCDRGCGGNYGESNGRQDSCGQGRDGAGAGAGAALGGAIMDVAKGHRLVTHMGPHAVAAAATGSTADGLPCATDASQHGGDAGSTVAAVSADGGGAPRTAGASATGLDRSPRTVRVVVAGLSTSCSQKAHNLCAGIEACDPRVGRDGGYVLCLDDDVALHPGTVRELVAEMERRPQLFMATGYPFDVPPPGSSFPAYLALCYHLPLLIAFSVAPDTSFVWGGCMLLRGGQLLPDDPAGLLAAWRRGGYSDDLILASFCTERGLAITVPAFAIFPQRLDPGMTWRAWLNYLHRQLFVLDTYTNGHNRVTNHTMMALHSALSWLLVLPSLAALLTAATKLLAPIVLPSLAAAIEAARHLRLLASAAAGVATDTRPGSSGGNGGLGGGAARLPALPGGVWAVLAGWGAAHLALVFMTAEILGLFRQLSPSARPVPLSWYRWGRLWTAMMLSNTVLPVVVAFTYLSPHVEWGGVVYRKRRGLVKPVKRRCGSSSSSKRISDNTSSNNSLKDKDHTRPPCSAGPISRNPRKQPAKAGFAAFSGLASVVAPSVAAGPEAAQAAGGGCEGDSPSGKAD